jgi:hypothetical protein
MIPDVHLIGPWDFGVHLQPRPVQAYIYHSSKTLPEQWFDERLTYVRLYEYRTRWADRLVNAVQIRPFVAISKEDRAVVQPWGMPLLPSEFLKPIAKWTSVLNYIGTVWGDDDGRSGNKVIAKRFADACSRAGVKLVMHKGVLEERCVELVRKSLCAANFGAAGHDAHDYLQCRVFKGISWGALAVTDTRAFHQILDDAFLFDGDWESTLAGIRRMTRSHRRELVRRQQERIGQYSYLHHWLNIAACLSCSYPGRFRLADEVIEHVGARC